MKACPYCAEQVQDEAIVCKRCRKEIGRDYSLKDAEEKMQPIGCALTLLITVPVLIIIVLAAMC